MTAPHHGGALQSRRCENCQTMAFVGDSSLGAASSLYSVPFLGLYAAVLGHGCFGDVMVRHDFGRGM
jgi:hypothetical protein